MPSICSSSSDTESMLIKRGGTFREMLYIWRNDIKLKQVGFFVKSGNPTINCKRLQA